MRTIDLDISWFAILATVCGISLCYVMMNLVALHGVASSLVVVSLSGVALIVLMTLTDKRFVHIDKAGICYRTWVKTRYVHADEIASLELQKLGPLQCLKVVLHNNRRLSFPYWSIDDADLQKAAQVLSVPISGRKHQVKA
ncbi:MULTISPECIES: hypothetical protein [Pseudoalteromonas]|uniref:PH domain-containing protein n=1 Tax=Pseudoalteromonas rubra TaxID=43658 RepID=A0A5S3UXD4_9GAMM|nr:MULTISPECIES: hypothetical protein [Pseudoalteromonas]MCG7564243.1 hypothetical protein [Pseudoalteromonas sp. McH1-42]MEC4090205.1 hypothetical protein [Pseudoalteromonas rubra]QPB84935.1 hypothetical protein CWC22_018875 [Pseudoalteromonas rubra]